MLTQHKWFLPYGIHILSDIVKFIMLYLHKCDSVWPDYFFKWSRMNLRIHSKFFNSFGMFLVTKKSYPMTLVLTRWDLGVILNSQLQIAISPKIQI